MKKHKGLLLVGSGLFVVLAGGYVLAQGPMGGPPNGAPPWGGPGGPPGQGGPPGRGGQRGGPNQQGGQSGMPPMEEKVPLPPSEVKIEVREGYRYITSNGIPDHPTGEFPNPNNPSAIRAQEYKFRVPLKPTVSDKDSVRHDLFGVALNGVPFDPATGEFWNNDRRWNYDALSGKLNLGTDKNNAHVQPGGIYHYHGIPQGIVDKRAKKGQMTMVGYAADGYPIYVLYGHTAATDAKSKLKKLRTSYRLKKGERPSGNEGPGGTYDGTFSADWEYVAGAGDLDKSNGRTGVTPEYPKGTYYYVLTDEFPFVPRLFHGAPDASFKKPRPTGNGARQGGPGGQGGPGNQGGPGGPPPGGQGGPGYGPPPPPGGGYGPPPGPPPHGGPPPGGRPPGGGPPPFQP